MPYNREERAPREPLPVPDEPPFKAYIGNLDYNVVDAELVEHFADLAISQITIGFKDNRPKGYAFVEFETKEGLEQALQLSGQPMKKYPDRIVKVDVAPAKPVRNFERRGGDRGAPTRDAAADAESEPRSEPKERKRLALKPRSAVVESSSESAQSQSKVKEDPFGGAVPRELVLKQRGVSTEELDDDAVAPVVEKPARNAETEKPPPAARKTESEKPQVRKNERNAGNAAAAPSGRDERGNDDRADFRNKKQTADPKKKNAKTKTVKQPKLEEKVAVGVQNRFALALGDDDEE